MVVVVLLLLLLVMMMMNVLLLVGLRSFAAALLWSLVCAHKWKATTDAVHRSTNLLWKWSGKQVTSTTRIRHLS